MRLSVRYLPFFAYILSMSFAEAFPSQADVKAASAIVSDLIGEEIKAANTGKTDRSDVATKIYGYVDEAETDAAKWLLLKQAFVQYSKAANYAKSAEVMRRILSDFKDIPPSIVLSLIDANAAKATVGNAPELVAMKVQIKMMNRCEEIVKDKKASSLQKAEAMCLMGNWDKGLALLSAQKGAVGDMAKAVKSGSKNISDVANFWWEYKSSLDTCKFFKAHAVELYRRGIEEGAISGLRKSVAEKRIAEFSELHAPGVEYVSTRTASSSTSSASSKNVAKGLAHRWSFNGSFADSVGGADAKPGGNAVLENGMCVLNHGWITLRQAAPSILGDFTVEVWYTERDRTLGSRVFKIMSEKYPDDNGMFSWFSGTSPEGRFSATNASITSDKDKFGFQLGKETYVAMTCKASGDKFLIVAYEYDFESKRMSKFSTMISKEHFSTVNLFSLGSRVNRYRNFSDAIASYNECRLWKRCLSESDILRSAKAGPDKLVN